MEKPCFDNVLNFSNQNEIHRIAEVAFSRFSRSLELARLAIRTVFTCEHACKPIGLLTNFDFKLFLECALECFLAGRQHLTQLLEF